jgi:hypothetical protein
MRRLVALGAVAFVVLLAAPASAAGSVTAVGWWTRSPVASAPEGGLTIGNAPDGPLSVAAVAVDLGTSGVSSATLSLEQAGGAAVPGPGQLVACVVGGSFPPDAGAPIEEAPATTCDATQAPVAVNGTTWTVNVGELVGDKRGAVGIALVPATGSASVWDLQLAKPTFTATPASGGGGGPSSAGSPFQSVAPSSSSPTPSARPSSSSFAVAKPPTVAAPRTPASTVAPSPSTTVADEGETAFVARPATATSTGRPIGQAVTLVLIAAVVGTGAGLVHRMAARRLAA